MSLANREDQEIINNTLRQFPETNKDEREAKRRPKSTEWRFIYDTSNGSNNIDGIVHFSSRAIRHQIKSWRSSYLLMPISISLVNSSTGVAVVCDGSEIIAWKSSALSFVHSMLLSINNTVIVNEDHLQHRNSLKYLLKSREFESITGPSRLYAKDTNLSNNDVGGIDATKYLSTGTNFLGNNPYFNEGLIKRASYLRGDYITQDSAAHTSATSINFFNTSNLHTAGPFSLGSESTSIGNPQSIKETYSTDLRIDLKDLHDVFDTGLDFLMFQDELDLTLHTTNSVTNTSVNYSPLQTVQDLSGSGAVAHLPVITFRGACRWYYKKYDLASHELSILENNTKNKSFKMDSYFTKTKFSELKNTSGDSVDHLISSSIINPIKVWSVSRLAGSALEVVNAKGFHIATQAYKTSNIEINSQRVFDSDVRGTYEHWNNLKQTLVDDTQYLNNSTITWLDYNYLYGGYNVYDLLVNKNSLVENSSSEIRFQCTKKDVATDFVFMVDRSCMMSINFGSNSETTMIQG
jgi:hypothetical protein